jgi:hypothetical protein
MSRFAFISMYALSIGVFVWQVGESVSEVRSHGAENHRVTHSARRDHSDCTCCFCVPCRVH